MLTENIHLIECAKLWVEVFKLEDVPSPEWGHIFNPLFEPSPHNLLQQELDSGGSLGVSRMFLPQRRIPQIRRISLEPKPSAFFADAL